MTDDRPFLGVMMMLAFCILAPLGDSIAKLLGGSIALGVLLLARFAIQTIILAPLLRKSEGDFSLPRQLFIWILLRTILHIVGIGLMFSALRYLPLADALAIAFVMPFIMLLLGHFFMGEHVSSARLLACFTGFMGTLLVIQPNFRDVGAPALLPLGVALVFALFMLVTRRIAKDLPPIKLQAISGLQATIILLPICLLWAVIGGEDFLIPSMGNIMLLLAMGVVGTVAHLFMTWSLRFAEASTVAPMQYLEIPFGTMFGWLIFREFPNGLAAIGITITVLAGLFIILRERQLAQRRPNKTVAD